MLMHGALLVNEEHNKKTGIPEGFVEVQRDDTNKIYDSDAAAACACSADAFEFEGTYEDGSKYYIWLVPVADVAELHPLAKVYRAHEHALSGRYAEAIQDLSDTRDTSWVITSVVSGCMSTKAFSTPGAMGVTST